MKRERCEKLGIPFNEAEVLKELETHAADKPKVALSKSERVMVQLEQVRVGSFAYPEKSKSFYELVVIYLSTRWLMQTISSRTPRIPSTAR